MNARASALEILGKIRRQSSWSSILLDVEIKNNGLSERDAALVTALVMNVQQNKKLFDFYIDSYCTKKPDPVIRDILYLGLSQIFCMDRIPVSAAVNESVKLCNAKGKKFASGLVNAVLRKAARGELPEIPDAGSDNYLSIRYSHPLWLIKRLNRLYGYEFTKQFCEANSRPAELCIHINTHKISIADYQRILNESEIRYHSSAFVPEILVLPGSRVTALPGFKEGWFFVQDEAAGYAVAAVGIEPGMKILDACSAPGGKAFSAAISADNKAEIIACDIHENKLNLIRSGAERLGITCITAIENDARVLRADFLNTFDVVIADVPCSGMGVIRKKPEIRYKDEEDISGLPKIQQEILDSVCHYVKPGGTLLYSTCTILPEENENIVTGFLSGHSDFRIDTIDNKNASKTFWPHIDGTDGFFVAKMRKN